MHIQVEKTVLASTPEIFRCAASIERVLRTTHLRGFPYPNPSLDTPDTLLTMICYEMSQLLVVTLVQFPRITAALLVKRLRVSPRVAGVVNMTSPALYHPFFSMRDMTRTV
jgi:hypothetical protein